MALVVFVALLGWVAAVAAQSDRMPRLPDAIQIARSADSPGEVAFNHSTHVDQEKPECTSCHPKQFRILKANAGRRPITHAEMEKGRACGACHDGKKAFGLQDDCTPCHRS